ncbi:MAG TPA: tetratricopeptide repeat protein [Syntrophorhabdaceae bacterium]|nr:tetratricopeptide repeat protein [Syntrophorhabdaceae bacterium]
MRIKRLVTVISIICLVIAPRLISARIVSEEARRHMNRGQAAEEIAKTEVDLRDAIMEYERAAALDPDWPELRFRLALVHEKVGSYDQAIRHLRRYLDISPDLRDKEQVQSRLDKLEYKLEKSRRDSADPHSLIGLWAPGGNNFGEGAFERFEVRAQNGKVEGGIRAYAVTEERGLSQRPRFVPVQWDGKTLFISHTRYFYCDKSVRADCCPADASLSLTMVDKDTMKGTIQIAPDRSMPNSGMVRERVWKRMK